jgi:hypothetical protein
MTAAVYSNATMPTASLSSVSPADPPSHPLFATNEDSIQKLKSNLVRYTRANDRRMVIRSLKDVDFLSRIPLATPVLPPDVSLSDLEKELVEEPVSLNSIYLKPLSTVDRNDLIKRAGINSGCLVMIKGLAESLCDENSSSLHAKTLYEILVTRMALTSASADAFFHLDSVLGCSELTVKHLTSGQKKQSSAPGLVLTKSNSYGSSSSTDENFINMTLYESQGEIHMTLDMIVEFGLFRRSDTSSNRPWITLQGVIHERANLSSGENYRIMDVKSPSLY